jgi:hypothetical protein
MTFTINTYPPNHELEFGLWVATAWVSPSPPGRVPRRGWPAAEDISGNAQYDQTFPFQCSHRDDHDDAAPPDGAASQRRRDISGNASCY